MAAKRGEKQRKRLKERGKLGVQKRRENIMRMGAESVEVAQIIFSGKLFSNETHIIRCLSHEDETHLVIEIDGMLYKPQTIRGLKKIIAERIWL